MIKRINITELLKDYNIITLRALNNFCIENDLAVIVEGDRIFIEIEIIKKG